MASAHVTRAILPLLCDRFDSNGEVSRSWKEQTLLNVVKSSVGGTAAGDHSCRLMFPSSPKVPLRSSRVRA